MYLSYLKNCNYKYIPQKFKNKEYILNGEENFLKKKSFNYKLFVLKSDLNSFCSRNFLFIYSKKLKFLQHCFKNNFTNKYYEYIIKRIHIKYFKHNNNITNYDSKCFHEFMHEIKYTNRFLQKGPSLYWLILYIVRNYKYRLWRNYSKFQKSIKGFRYLIDWKMDNLLLYWYKVKYYLKFPFKDFFLSRVNFFYKYILYDIFLRRNYFFTTSRIYYYFKEYILLSFITKSINFLFLFKKFWILKLFKKIKNDRFFFFLLYRFPSFNIEHFNVYKKKRQWNKHNLPMFAQMSLIYNFIKYRGVFIIIGKYLDSSGNMTFSGYQTPYIVTKNRKSFWRDITKCFALYSYYYLSINNNIGFLLYPKLIKLNLFRNVFVEIGWSVATRIILGKKLITDRFSNYYLNSKSLLISNFYFNGEQVLSNVNNYFNHLFNNYPSLNFNYFLQKQKIRKKPISMHRHEITSMRWIRDNIKSFFIEKYKRTWFITRFCKYYENPSTAGIQNLIWIEMRLSMILIRCKIVYLLEDAYDLIKNGYVFVNGIICYNVKYIVKLHDRIQFGLSKSFHLYHRELLNNALIKYKRLPAYVYSRFSGKNKFETVRRDVSARWPLKALWVKNDIPRYLEVDYITMTIFVLYYPLYLKDIFPYYYLHIKFLSARCYNWRFFH